MKLSFFDGWSIPLETLQTLAHSIILCNISVLFPVFEESFRRFFLWLLLQAVMAEQFTKEFCFTAMS